MHYGDDQLDQVGVVRDVVEAIIEAGHVQELDDDLDVVLQLN